MSRTAVLDKLLNAGAYSASLTKNEDGVQGLTVRTDGTATVRDSFFYFNAARADALERKVREAGFRVLDAHRVDREWPKSSTFEVTFRIN